MPLLYVPMIMYASWMEYLTHPFVDPFGAPSDDDDKEVDAFAVRTHE
jgi:hypothetical protein